VETTINSSSIIASQVHAAPRLLFKKEEAIQKSSKAKRHPH